MPTATQYADWIVEYCATELGAPTDPMSLEKQLYYAQSFSLALGGTPLFDDDFEAWTYGPVVKPVWKRYSGSQPLTSKAHHLFTPSPPPLNPDEETRGFLADVVGFLGRLSAVELSRATHNENPWLEARDGLGPRDYSADTIEKTTMQAYYSDLIADGEEALSRLALLADLPTPRWGWLFVAGVCARKMVTHPFYFHGLSLWGARTRFSDAPTERGEIDPDVYRPLSKSEADDLDSFDTIESFLASLKT